MRREIHFATHVLCVRNTWSLWARLFLEPPDELHQNENGKESVAELYNDTESVTEPCEDKET